MKPDWQHLEGGDEALQVNRAATNVILWDALKMLVSILNKRTRTEDHSLRVADYAVRIGVAARLDESKLEELRLGALLHDLGHISFSADFINKDSASLSEADRKMMRDHTRQGVELLNEWPSLKFLKPYILYHQEWINGTGYPLGLSGDQIPVVVQIVSIADVYEALRHPRSYLGREGYSHHETIDIMKRQMKNRWDAKLFDLFVEVSKDWTMV